MMLYLCEVDSNLNMYLLFKKLEKPAVIKRKLWGCEQTLYFHSLMFESWHHDMQTKIYFIK